MLEYEVSAGGLNGKLMRHETPSRENAIEAAKAWRAAGLHSVRVIGWDGDSWTSVDWWKEAKGGKPIPPPKSDERVRIIVFSGDHRHDEAVHIENAREWAANQLAENGEIEVPADGDPDPSQVDDATVVQMLGASIGSNLDYDKLR